MKKFETVSKLNTNLNVLYKQMGEFKKAQCYTFAMKRVSDKK